MTEGLPREWSRGPQWVPAARQKWEPVLVAAAAAWAMLELLSVSGGARSSALVNLTAEEIPTATRDAAAEGLLLVPLSYDGHQTRTALTRPGQVGDWLVAWRGCDDEKMGELLGFPECCRRHFVETWKRGVTDTIIPIAKCGLEGSAGPLNVDGPPEANLLLRHLGVRLVPHLPCSPTCEATVELGRRIAELGREAGIDVDPIYQLLDLPATYSALHGVAVIETPVLRLWAGTDATPDQVTVTRAATETRASARVSAGAHTPSMPGSTPGPATIWEDNGFASREAMDRAHATVLEAVGQVDSALDLGAGDGELLAKIAGEREGIWAGVEVDEGRATRGAERHPEVYLEARRIEEAARWPDESSWGEPYDVVLLMPGRLLEMDPEDAERVRGALPHLGRRLVLYAYGDTLREHGGLASFARKAGLPEPSSVSFGVHVQAGAVRWHHGCGNDRPEGAELCPCHHHDGPPDLGDDEPSVYDLGSRS